jgi:hypothetical protein
LIVIVAVLSVAGVSLPFAIERIASAIGPRLAPGVDPQLAEAVARDAIFGAEMLDRGVGRILFPVHIVTRIHNDAGYCTDPNPGLPLASYGADVVALTWFGIPGSRIDVSCGGWKWVRRGWAVRQWSSPPPTNKPVRITAPRDTGARAPRQ